MHTFRRVIISTQFYGLMMKKITTILLTAFVQMNVFAQNKFVDQTTDVLCLAPAATGIVKAIVEKDKKGVLELGLSSATGIALNYGLNACIRKDRPNMPPTPGWSDHHAFPSTHTMAAFDGATFLMRRYGWKWGVPAYVISTYVAWGRVYTKQHDGWDVLAGATVGACSALIYTRPFAKNMDLTVAPVLLEDNKTGLYLLLRF